MKQFYLTPTEIEAVKTMCRNMTYCADYNPNYNHMGIAGVFINGSMNHTPYAMVYVGCTEISDEQLEKFVDLCNSFHHAFRVFDGTTHHKPYRAFRNEDMKKFVTVVNGDCCDIYTRKIIRMNFN